MFKKTKDKELDINSLNDMIHTGKRLLNIGYFMAIVALVLLGTYIIQEWKLLRFLKDILGIISPIFIGFILAWLCAPMVKYLQNKKFPRIVATIIVYLGLILSVVLLGYLFIPSMVRQISDFIISLPDVIGELKEFTDKTFTNFSNPLISAAEIKSNVYSTLESLAIELTDNLPDKLISIGKSIISGGLNIILGLMVGFYVLYDFDKINKGIKRIIPKEWHSGYNDLCNRINNSLRSYVQGLFLVMFLVFITQSIGLTIAGLKAPLIFALFCAITDVIPYFGPYIGAIPAVIVGFTTSPVVGVCCIISIVVVQLLENNFYQPLIMGHTMKLHPVTIMIGLLVFQHLFGILGMIVATPAIACIKVIIEFIIEKIKVIEEVEE